MKMVLNEETRAELRKQLGYAIGGFIVPEEYHDEIKNDPLYIPGEPIALFEYFPSIRGVDPVSRKLTDMVVESALSAIEKVLAVAAKQDSEASAEGTRPENLNASNDD